MEDVQSFTRSAMDAPNIFPRFCWLPQPQQTRFVAAAALCLLLFFRSTESRAAIVSYTATDLADTTPGEDLWRFSYHVGGYTFGLGEGLTITFDRTLFTKLQSPPPVVNADWDAISLQPDLGLSSNGSYDAQALHAAPSLADDFRLTAVWLGTGSPGAQPFTIYNSSFTPISSGQTTSVPEPGSVALVGYGLAALCLRRRRSDSALLRP